ncbi:MAG TPA: sialate O-acetylesterase, partial [Polyangia bacterium]
NFRKAGPFYALFMDAARELKGKVTFGGLFTMFGITEYRLGTPGLNGLAACLTGLINEVRADLGDPQIPLLVGDWNQGGTGIYAPDSEYGRVVRPQIQMVPRLEPLSAVIPTDGLPMQDDRHLNIQGHKTWAERGFAIMMQKGWLPWAKK